MKVLSIVLGIIYSILGILCFFTPIFAASVIGYVIAAVVLFSGIWAIVSYFVSKGGDRIIKKSGWSLFFGIIAVILGIFLIFNPITAGGFVAVLLGILVIISGISSISFAFNLKSMNEPWALALVIGILCILAGILLLMDPLITVIALGIFVGISLLVEGINFISIGTKL